LHNLPALARVQANSNLGRDERPKTPLASAGGSSHKELSFRSRNFDSIGCNAC